MKKKILISTGGSGGHVIPAICLYEHLKLDFEIFLTTDRRGTKFINKKNFNYNIIDIPKIPKNILKIPYILFLLILSFFQSFNFIKKNSIQILISTGGYMSFPLCLVAKILNLEIILLEPNLVLGRSNRLFLRYAKKILCYSENIINFPKKYQNKIYLIKPLLRKNLYQEKKNINKQINKPFKILVIGGSQGAQFFDSKISELMIDLNKDYEISLIQQVTDQSRKNFLIEKYNNAKIKNEIFGFDEEIYKKYYQIDFAITRSGASTISELVFFNIPFVAIPLPYSKDNHQYFNAKNYYEKKFCWIINQSEYKKENLKELIQNILQNSDSYFEKKNNMVKFSYQNSWNNINQSLLNLINEN